ncbi:MAG: hypothetical protein H8D23_02405 [Candidatus Brocadiales bacterium]|nr:hypothetical protein [Candidatus Brocadiales bacterium]
MSGGTHNKLTVDDKYSFSFDGIDEYVDTGLATNDANFSGEFSITCWVKVPSSIPGDHYLLGSRSGDHGIYAYIGNSSGRPAFCLKSEIADSSNALCLTDIRGEGWCLIVNVCKIDNGIYKAFNSVNGSDLDTFNTLGDGFVYNDMTNSNNQLLFKADYHNAYLEGQMSSIAYFSKALSQDEIDGLYANTTSPQEIGDLFLYYRMGDRGADSLNPFGSAHLDAVAGSDGTPYNMEIGDITEDAP